MRVLAIAGGVVGLLAGVVTVVNTIHNIVTRNAVERAQAEIRLVTFEHETRFSALHQRRVEVLAELYARLVRAERAISTLVHPLQLAGEPSIEEKGPAAAAAGNAFRDYFLEDRIWLPKNLVGVVAAFDSIMSDALVRFGQAQQNLARQSHYGADEPYMDAWTDAWKKVSKEAPEIREAIEDHFRAILGVVAAPHVGADTLSKG